jgi:hypothetical protein
MFMQSAPLRPPAVISESKSERFLLRDLQVLGWEEDDATLGDELGEFGEGIGAIQKLGELGRGGEECAQDGCELSLLV